MDRRTHFKLSVALCIACYSAPAAAVWGYVPGDRWEVTSAGSAGVSGDPVTLRWSIVADGTMIPGESPSNLISYLDASFGGGTGSDYTLRPWFNLLADPFDRWSEVSGVTFVYEPNDDNTSLASAQSGVANVRGDIRLSGSVIDGSGSTLAYAYFPDYGDIVIDTGETSFFTSPTNNFVSFRNTLVHELGHALGLDHVESSNTRLLMEPVIDTSFDGPQLDDIRGIQGVYGDANEKSFNGLGNDVAARAIGLGALIPGSMRTIGADADGTQSVLASEVDFVSIANANDFDYFSFTVGDLSLLSATLTPLGGTFNQAAQGQTQSSFNASARNDLSLSIYADDGSTLLSLANATALGGVESIAALSLASAGKYFARVSGSNSSVQLYSLQLSVTSTASPSADFDDDGDVDGNDFLIFQRGLGGTGGLATGDADQNGVVNAADLAIYRDKFRGGGFIATATPEPASGAMAASVLLLATLPKLRRRRHAR